MGRLPIARFLLGFSEARSFERITARCARQSKGEFQPFGRIRTANPANVPFPA
jgi:hypothetical protein